VICLLQTDLFTIKLGLFTLNIETRCGFINKLSMGYLYKNLKLWT